MPAALTARCRAAWAGLPGVPVAFGPAVRVAVAPHSRLGPPGWTAFVVLDGAAIATAPDQGTARAVQRVVGPLPVTALARRTTPGR